MSRGFAFATSSTRALLLTCLLTVGVDCSRTKAPSEKGQAPAAPAMTPPAGRTNGGAIAQASEDGQWLMPAKNFASTHSAFGPAILIAVRPWERSVTAPFPGPTAPANRSMPAFSRPST